LTKNGGKRKYRELDWKESKRKMQRIDQSRKTEKHGALTKASLHLKNIKKAEG